MLKKTLLYPLLLGLSVQAFADVDIIYPNNEVKTLNKDLENIRLGNDQLDGESIGRVISFINHNREDMVQGHSDIPKIYFRPQFDGRQDSGQGRIYYSNGTASLRLEQAFYFTQKSGEKIYIPFDGAEVNVYVAGLNKKENGAVERGKVLEISSSLVKADFEKFKLDAERKINIPSQIKSHLNDRIQLLDILESRDTEALSEIMGLNKSSYGGHQNFIKAILEDENIFTKIVEDNRSNMSAVYVRNQKGNYQLTWRIKGFYGLPLDLDLNLHDKGPIVVGAQSQQKNINVNIYTGSTLNLKKRKRRSGKSYVWKDREVESGLFKQEDYDLALINLSKVVEYFKGEFQWNSFDNKGSDLDATVRFKGSRLLGSAGLRQNAAWAGAPYNQFLFGRGGDTLGDFLNAFDVIGHEFCHAIVSNTANLDDGNQQGALNEHVCDILGVGFEGDLLKTGFDFKIGEKVVLESDRGLRDFLNPSASFSEQPSHMNQVNEKFGAYCFPNSSNDKCGVHYSNGVLNLAVGKMVKDLGWPRMKGLVFEVLTKKLRSTSDFNDYKTQMIRTCDQQSSFSEADCKVIDRHFASVGLADAVSTSSSSGTSSGASSSPETDYEQQICDIMKDLCTTYRSSAIEDTCKRCGH